MVFGLWSSSSHTPIKYRCAVKKSYQVPHACLNGGFRGYAWVPNIDGTKIVRQLQIDQTKLRISWMKSTIKGNRSTCHFFFSLWWKWAESLKVHPERVLGWVSLDETHPNLGEHGFRVPVMGRFCWGYGCVAWIWIGHDGKRPDIIWFSSEYVPQSRFSVFTHSWFLCTF